MKLIGIAALAAALVSAQDPGTIPPKAPIDGLLVTGPSVEPLTAETEIALAADRTLALSPGVRMTRTEGGFSLATHDGAGIRIQAGLETLALPSPVLGRVTESGLELGGASYPAPKIAARRQGQDDTDANLRAMQESARKLREKRALQEDPKRKLRVRWLYGENPAVTSEVFNSSAVRQLLHISPMGF